jgi:ABC-2 type transport system ATP-binding protein
MRVRALVIAAAATASLVVGADARAASGPTTTDEVVTSFDGTPIAVTVFRPVGATSANPVPMVLHSHGWGGSRTTSAADTTVDAFLRAGYGVVSFDQRGWGDSGGQANVQDPDFEVRDTRAVVDWIARLTWVRREAPGDPVLGAIGGSYGGGYQTMTALAEQAARPAGTRFDALAPEITWFDLPDSLAPSDVPRTEWLAVLYGAGAHTLPPYIHEAFVQGMATGTLPASLKAEFRSHGPRWFTDRGVRLDVPVLLRQGNSDNLFNLNQALRNFDTMLTPRARAASRLLSFNGGHALPAVVPRGRSENSVVRPPAEGADVEDVFLTAGDACAGPGGFLQRTIDFFDVVLKGRPRPSVPTAYSLTTDAGDRCLRLATLPARRSLPLAEVLATSGVGPPLYVPVRTGPLTVAGIPRLRAKLTTLVPDTRVFLGLAVGTSPADATLVGNNVLPLRAASAVSGTAVAAELPAVAVDVPAGQTLYLVVSPVADQFFAHGSRAAGAARLEGVVLDLPVVSR